MSISLTTERLLLRPFREEDVEPVARYWNDAEWSRYLDFPYPYTRQDAAEFVDNNLKGDAARALDLVVEADGEWAGTIHISLADPGHPGPRGAPPTLAGLAYLLARPFWRRGIGFEAAHACADYAFTQWNAHKVWATADPRNVGSTRIMEKLGMKREAYLRKHRKGQGGEICDEVYYGVLREEWPPESSV